MYSISGGGGGPLPRVEASGTLVTIPIGLRVILYPRCQISFRSSLVLLVISVPSLHPYLPKSTSPYPSPSPSPYDYSVPNPPPTPPSSAACLTIIPRISRVGCSHHFLDRCSPRFRSAARKKSMIGRVAIYCTTVLWRREIYTLFIAHNNKIIHIFDLIFSPLLNHLKLIEKIFHFYLFIYFSMNRQHLYI